MKKLSIPNFGALNHRIEIDCVSYIHKKDNRKE